MTDFGHRTAPARVEARPRRRQVSIHEALAVVRSTTQTTGRTERLPLMDAAGRVLAAAALAAVDVPPFNRAAMDGYAVIADDTRTASVESPVVLECLEQVFAGGVAAASVRAGCCTAVATGAPMPEGADAVVMIERTHADGPRVQLFAPATRGEHVGARGADIHVGHSVAPAGAVLTAGRVGALAAIGVGEVDVFARPRVAIVSTGPELTDPGRALDRGRIYDVNKHALGALAVSCGVAPRFCDTAADSHAALMRTLDGCRGDALAVFSGGTSVGAHDLIVETIGRMGTVLFDSIALKPGKSTAFGLVGGLPVLALPGYPAACLLNAYVLLVPLLLRLARLPDDTRRVLAPLSRRVTSPPDTQHFSTVRLENGLAVPVFKKAGDVTSVSEADGYIALGPGVASLDAGTMVEVTLFSR